MGVLIRELQKKQRHLPVRKLLEQIPRLLRLLKPCLLMSPLSVAQYLRASGESYDIVVFDDDFIGDEDTFQALEQYGRDLTALAGQGKLDPARLSVGDPVVARAPGSGLLRMGVPSFSTTFPLFGAGGLTVFASTGMRSSKHAPPSAGSNIGASTTHIAAALGQLPKDDATPPTLTGSATGRCAAFADPERPGGGAGPNPARW